MASIAERNAKVNYNTLDLLLSYEYSAKASIKSELRRKRLPINLNVERIKLDYFVIGVQANISLTK